MEFLEAPVFARFVNDYLEDDEYRLLQNFLAAAPEAGDLIAGTGGCRKLRWSDPRRHKGKRGGLRVIYYFLRTDSQIWLMTLYDKDEAKDLTAPEKRLLKAAIEREALRRSRQSNRKGGHRHGPDKDSHGD